MVGGWFRMSIALGTYNPSVIPKETLLAEFAAREAMLSNLIAIVRSNEPGHPCRNSLLIGPWGFGKTTSLLALKYQVEEDPILAETWIPLLFDEEQYQIADLAGFWLECLRLAEKELEPHSDGFYPSLSLSRDPSLESLARNAFLGVLEKKGKRALLLVDNLDDILGVVSDPDEQRRLRVVLLEESLVSIVGTVSAYFEAVPDASQPFYNFFRIFRLDSFNREELRKALEAMWKARWPDSGEIPLPDGDDYWRGLHILTGGNPRLIKMIFQLLEQGVPPDYRAQLEGLLDACTPCFNHRIERMSPQQRRVFDAIALAWDPVPLGDIAPALRMDSNQASAQVRLLVDAGLVTVAGGTDRRRTYQVTDRFSNIYYFMRYNRAGRSRFEWFTLTMKAVLGSERCGPQLERIREQRRACTTKSDVEDKIGMLVGATRVLQSSSRRMEGQESVVTLLTRGKVSTLRHFLNELYFLNGVSTQLALEEKYPIVEFIEGLPPGTQEAIGYRPGDPSWWYGLIGFLEADSLFAVAEQAYRKVIELDPASVSAWNNLGNLLQDHLGRYDESETAYRKAIELDPEFSHPWSDLARLLEDHYERYGESEAAYRRAMELDPHFAYPKARLADLLVRLDPHSMEAPELATVAVTEFPEVEWAQLVFKRVAINTPDLSARVLRALAGRLKVTPAGRTDADFLALYKFAFDCIIALIRNDRADDALDIIETEGSQEAFDIPMRAIRLIKHPEGRQKLAAERLALVEAFLEQVGSQSGSEPNRPNFSSRAGVRRMPGSDETIDVDAEFQAT
jgi:tetratricopeptide (TPR) repeat protein